MKLPPLFIECVFCGDGDDCQFCDGRHYLPVDDVDVAILIDEIADTPALRRRPGVVAALLDARDDLVDLILRR